MWLVPDWLSFAGVSVPAFLLVEINIVPTNRRQAQADASCLRYARVLMELVRPVWWNTIYTEDFQHYKDDSVQSLTKWKGYD